MILSNSVLDITLVSAPVSILHTIGVVSLWYGLAVTSTVVKTLLRLLLFTLSTSSDPRNISSSLMQVRVIFLFTSCMVLYSVYFVSFLPSFAEMTPFMAKVALNTSSRTLFCRPCGTYCPIGRIVACRCFQALLSLSSLCLVLALTLALCSE